MFSLKPNYLKRKLSFVLIMNYRQKHCFTLSCGMKKLKKLYTSGNLIHTPLYHVTS